jgi:hypothetical protein
VTGVVLIPGVLALLPEYASIADPVAKLRTVVLEAVAGLDGPVEVLADEQGRRVGEWALEAAGASAGTAAGGLAAQPKKGQPTGYLVVGNGSAKRSTEAPGYLDTKAAAFDAELGRCLKEGLSGSLAGIDVLMAKELWASVEGIVAMAGLPDLGTAEVLYDDDPFGVQYWVMRWRCAL